MSELGNIPSWAWLCLGLGLMVLEILLPGVYLLWLGLGGLMVGLFAALFPEASLAIQLVIFAISALLSILIGIRIQTRKMRVLTPQQQLNNELAKLVGRRCLVTSDFAGGRGRIRVQDSSYPAWGDSHIKAGSYVVVTAIEDGQLRVAAAPDEAGSSA
jgi:membrane protein implicated in regulation of membrane protease activity